MAVNTYNNAVKITEMAMDVMVNNLAGSKHVTHKYSEEFGKYSGAKHGDILNVRLPGYYGDPTAGPVAVPVGYVDAPVPVQVFQYNKAMEMTTAELMLNLEDGEGFKQNVMKPLIAPLADFVDRAVCNLFPKFGTAFGTPGTEPTDMSSALNAKAYLQSIGCPNDDEYAYIMHPKTQASIVNGLRSTFNPQDDISAQFKTGRMGRQIAGLKADWDPNVPTMTMGTLQTSTTVAVTTTSVNGATTLVLKNLNNNSTDVIKAGTSIQIAGCYAVNYQNKTKTPYLKSFSTVGDVVVNAGAATLTLSEAIVSTGAFQNVDSLPQADALVTFFGAANENAYSGKISTQGIVMHKDAIGLIWLPMKKPDAGNVTSVVLQDNIYGTGMPIRMVQWYNGQNDVNLIRFDIMFGAAILRQNYAARVVG